MRAEQQCVPDHTAPESREEKGLERRIAQVRQLQRNSETNMHRPIAVVACPGNGAVLDLQTADTPRSEKAISLTRA